MNLGNFIPFILALLISNIAFCQERKYEKINGKIKIDGELYCLYKKIPIEYKNGGSRIEEFTDHSFSTNDSLPVIYIEARALSLFDFKTEKNYNFKSVKYYGGIAQSGPQHFKNHYDPSKLINYYKIEFSPIQKEINVLFHKETLHYFIKDLVWYHVFSKGKFNEANAEKLIEKWQGKKIDFIPYKIVENTLNMSYLQADNWKRKNAIARNDYRIDFENKKIYRADSIIASYTLSKLAETYTSGLATSYVTHYYIVSNEGKILSDSYSNANASFGTFTYFVDNKPSYITYPLVDKCEQKQIAVAVDVLIQFGKL